MWYLSWYLYGLTLLAGFANAIRPGQNATLSKSSGLPVTAALMTLLVGTAALLVGGIALGKLAMLSGRQLVQVPWWAWPGGLLSVLLILAQLCASPAIGAASFLGVIATVGAVTSIGPDNYGWVGFAVHPASLWRIGGGVLMLVGVALGALS